jgi:predicted  nucleic acid-binding Zn-ribbon protein
MFGRAGLVARLAGIEARLEDLARLQREAVERLERELARLEQWRARAESAEQRLRELGEQTAYLIEELSEARRWLHARGSAEPQASAQPE